MPTVNDIYQQVLRRPAEPEGLAYWTSIFGDYVDQNELAQFKTAAAPELVQRGALPEDIMARVAASPDAPVKIGDMYYQGIYGQSTGSGETFDRGPLTSYISYTDAENRAGGQYTKYDTTGEKAGTGVQQKVESNMLPFLLAAGGLALSLPPGIGEAAGGGGLLGGAGTTGLTLSQLGGTAGATALTAAETAALYGTGGALASTIPAATAAATAATALTPAATALTASQIAQLASAGLSVAQIAQIGTGLLSTAGSVAQSAESKAAALDAAQKIQTATDQAVLASQFRPIGMTTRFGTSNFAFDPVTGRMIDANYNLSPEAKAQQDRLAALANAGLTQAEGAQAQYAPLQTGAQSLFKLGQGLLDAKTDPRLADIASQYLPLSQQSKDLTALGSDYLALSPESQRLKALGGDYLTQSEQSKMLSSLGSKYIAQSPEQVAQNYLNQQMALLQPGRELELATLQNKLQQQGRGGLSVAQGGSYGATTPELQALYNARAKQEAELAAYAQQAGQKDVLFGAGLFETGQKLGIEGQKFGADLIGTGQKLGIEGQQFGSTLIGAGQKLGIEGQQFGIDALAKQQALEKERLTLGGSLFTQGATNLGSYYAGQKAAYDPYTAAMAQVQALETAAQQPFASSIALANTQATASANAGRLAVEGARAAGGLTTSANATTNPYAQAAIAAGQPGSAWGSVLGGLFGTAPSNWDFSSANPYAALNPYFTATPPTGR